MTGVVHLVGAGPGDPELITVRGARLLAAADAVVHDRLVSPELLALARPGALRIDAGKTGYGRSVPQTTTSELLVRLARAGLTVVRLKGGDPFVFGRGGEEALALRAAGVPFTIVPGVTSGIAGPAYAGRHTLFMKEASLVVRRRRLIRRRRTHDDDRAVRRRCRTPRTR